MWKAKLISFVDKVGSLNIQAHDRVGGKEGVLRWRRERIIFVMAESRGVEGRKGPSREGKHGVAVLVVSK